MRHSRSLLLLLVSCSGFVGCTSLLGDFSGNQGSPGDDSGAVDSAASDGTTGGDAAPEASPSDAPGQDSPSASGDSGLPGDGGMPLVPLGCTTWKYPSGVDISDLASLASIGTAESLYNTLTTFSAGPTTPRAVVLRNGYKFLATIDSLDTTKSPPALTTVNIPNASGSGTSQALGVMRLTGGFGVVTGALNASTQWVMSLYPFLDTNPVSPLPAPIALGTLPGPDSIEGPRVGVAEVSPGNYFIAVFFSASTGNQNFFAIGIASGGTPAQLTVVDTSTSPTFTSPVLVHAGSSIYAYVPPLSGGAGAFYQEPDTAGPGGTGRTTIPGLATGSELAFSQVVDGVLGSTSGTTNLGYQEVQATDGGAALAAYVFRASPVPNASLATLTAADIPSGISITDLASVPLASGSGGTLFGDDFVVLGTGQDGSGNATGWVNFLWLDVHGVVRGNQTGLNGLLPGVGPSLGTIGAAPGVRTAQQAAWHVLWTQQVRNDAGQGYGVLNYNELDCK
jgi:hypothetical protein